MKLLNLRFLGNPEIYYEEQPLKLPTRKALALLVYLVVEGGVHSREKLVALFWPESEASLGYAALRNTLTRLRAALRQAGPPLLDQDGLLGFDFSCPYTLDLHLIETAVQAISADPPEITLQLAATAYQADFLEGFSLPDAPAFDDWASFQRERWHYQMNLIFEALSGLQLDRRDFEAGLTTTMRWVAHNPLNEAAYCRLMQLHFMKGDRVAALQAYINCQTALRVELGIEAAAETRALAERIRTHDFTGPMLDFGLGRDQSKTHARQRAKGPLVAGSLKSKIEELPFAGRAAEHAQLAASYQAVRQEQLQVVVIQGEAGIGKTRLATEFLNWLAVHSADVLPGRAFEAGGRLPYQPIVEALRQRLEQENAPDDLLSDIWLAELSRLLPELRDRYPDLPPPTADESLVRSRLPEAIARLGQALAARRPVVLFIDDVQWADAASLDLLHYLARSWTERQVAVLFLLTLRTEALLADPSLETWLLGLERDSSLKRLVLEPLTAEETEQLALQLAGEPINKSAPLAAFARWLFTETAGQPLFIAESLKALLEQGFLNFQTDTAGRSTVDFSGLAGSVGVQQASLHGLIPPGVRQVILARSKRLTPTATALLTAAAVLGWNCSFEQLRQVAELSEREALPALDELLNSRLLLESHDTARPYHFSHDKIRDVIYTEAGDARRRVYHRRAFEMLERMAVPPAELAPHALAARLIEPAFRYSLAAGNADMALFAIHNAISHYEQARTLISQPAASFNLNLRPALADIHHLYAQLSRAYELRGDYMQARATCQEMLAQAETAGQPAMACAALNRLASLAIYSQQIDQAQALLAEAQRIAEVNSDTASLAQTEWSLGQLTHHSNDFIASRHHSQRALSLARELNDPALIAGSSNTLAYALIFLGQVKAGAEVMEVARAGYAGLGNRALEADSLVGLASARILNGEIEASITAARLAYAIGREIENPFGQAMSQSWLICGLVDRGEYEEAIAIAERNLVAVREQEVAPKMLAAFSAGYIYWALGDAQTAAAVHQELHSLLVEAKVPGYLEQNTAHLCVDAALAGDWQNAHIYARQALAYRDYQALPLLIAPRWPETEALLRGGDLELAREDARRWGELASHIPRYRPLYLRSLALLAQWEQSINQAIAYLEEADTLAKAIGLPGEQWQILAKLAELYRASKNNKLAQQAFGKAHEIVQALAAHMDNEGLRTRFLAAEAVRPIVDKANWPALVE